MFWANWTALEWIMLVIAVLGVAFAGLQLFKRAGGDQAASGGGVNVGGDVGGNVTTNSRKDDDAPKSDG